jgi:hypothetical protein
MANLDKLAQEKEKKNKATGGMNAAITGTEKIRGWV